MQRINISVDVGENEILSKEIEKAIEGAVKAKAREFFHEKIENEVKRIAVAEFERLNKRGGYYNSDSVVEKRVKELLDAKLTEKIGEITVSRQDVQNRRVVSAVRQLYPQEILRLAEQKEIEDLRQRVKDLETENEALKAGKQEVL